MSVETSSPYNLRSRSNGSNNAARQERAERPTHTAGTELEEEAPSRPRSFSKSNFPHVRQRYDWDCGLVCCQMCLKWVDKAQTFAAITSRCTTQSTWSIDLAYLLHGYGIEARYFTITWGTDDSYQAIDYYKENLENDKARVNELFQRATEIGLHVEMRSVEMDQIIQAVRKETCVAIVLVDTQRFEQGCSAAAERRRKLGRGMEEGEEGAPAASTGGLSGTTWCWLRTRRRSRCSRSATLASLQTVGSSTGTRWSSRGSGTVPMRTSW